MKFSCDSCGAAYMISDEKVGPNGVKVRCKKCGNQITVHRTEEARSAPVLERVAPAAAPGLDEELGSAFDNAFGDRTAPSEPSPAAAPAPAPPGAAAPSPAPQEWYVAIGEAQVGPLPLAEVKKRWEAGDIGPDSLVWRPGMAEWGPLSGVPELAAFLAPVPQPTSPSTAPAASVFAAPTARQAAPQPRPAGPGQDVEWKPTGASALAALASEELASRATSPSAAPAPPRSVMEQLPDSGGVDPTGAIPLPIKAMERTGERPAHRSSVARGAEEVRHKRTMRTVVLVAVLVVVAAVGGALGWVQFMKPVTPPAAVAVQVAPAPAVTPAPVAVEPTPVAATNAVAPVASAAAPAAPAPVAAAEPEKAAEVAPGKRGKAPAARPVRPAAPVAAAARPTAEKPASEKPTAEKPAAKKKDGLLDFDQGADDDLAAALGSGSGGRKVYVPPAAGAASAAPDRLSDAQLMESVRLHSDDLQRCVSEQRAREPGAKGTIKVAWVIQADGSSRDVRCVTPEYAQGEFARCLTGVVRSIRFPRVGDPKGQNVTFPFQF